MAIRRHPYLQGKLIVPTWNGTEIVTDETPELVSALNQLEMQAGISTSRPKGDNATLVDFLEAYKGNRSSRLFHLWATMNQLTPRHSMTLELEAAASGQPLTRDGDEPEADPRRRQSVPLMSNPNDLDDDGDDEQAPKVSDGDLDSMTFPAGTTLAALRKAGIIRPGMSAPQLDARLKRIGVGLQERMEKHMEAAALGWFDPTQYYAANRLDIPPVPRQQYTLTDTPNGDTFRQRANDDHPMRGHLPPGRVANMQASRAAADPTRTLRDIAASLKRACPWRTKGLTITATADRESRC